MSRRYLVRCTTGGATHLPDRLRNGRTRCGQSWRIVTFNDDDHRPHCCLCASYWADNHEGDVQ